MKKMLLSIIIILMPFITFATTLGDANNDGKIDSKDYVLIRKYILGKIKLTDVQKTNADVNSDGIVNAKDYVIVKKHILGIEKIVQPANINVNSNYIEVYFLNTMNNSTKLDKVYESNNTSIIKTASGKYILLDTGIYSAKIRDVIYNKLKKLQNKDKIVIDYLIISHLHYDHYGNATTIMKDSNYTIKNIILKKEKLEKETYDKIENVAKSRKINIIESTTLAEGETYNIDSNIKMYLFNTKDVFANEANCKTGQKYYGLEFGNKPAGKELAIDSSNKNFYFDGLEFYYNNGSKFISDELYNSMKYSDLKLHTTTSPKFVDDINKRIKSNFYAYLLSVSSNCNANVNSIGLVFQVITEKGNKYIYFPGDIENNGYSFFGEYDSQYKTIIHGAPSSYYYEYEMVNDKPQYNITGNNLIKNKSIPVVRSAVEYKTAKKISETFSDIKNNLVVYQSAHHGCNNSKESIDILNLNRKGVYSIATYPYNIITSMNIRCLIGNQNLNKTFLMNSGSPNPAKDGVICTIKGDGTTSCKCYREGYSNFDCAFVATSN